MHQIHLKSQALVIKIDPSLQERTIRETMRRKAELNQQAFMKVSADLSLNREYGIRKMILEFV